MLSLKNISAIKCAIQVCVCSRLKREMLCASGSDYDLSNENSNEYDRKQRWNKIAKEKATEVLKTAGLPKELRRQITNVVIPIGMRMLTWAVYHESIVGFSREYSINFLKSSFFTYHGIIDNKKAAEELMKDETLSIRQKYTLACLYCTEGYISTLYEQMMKEDTKSLHGVHSGLMKFWSYFLVGEIDKLRGEKTTDRYRLRKAIESGSKAAVEYCLSGTTMEVDIVDAAVETVKNSIRRNSKIDWIVFRDRKYYHSEISWVPSAYYVDILGFLLSKMREDQRIEFFKKDVEGLKYKEVSYENPKRSRVLEYFLKYPYQNLFMKTARMMWEFLPENNYAALLMKICNKIESRNDKNIEYGEEKSYNYRGLLQEFWDGSPERYKRYVLSNQKITYEAQSVVTVKAGIELLNKLLTLQNFKPEDENTIRIILDSATATEIENIISYQEMRNIFTELMEKEKWDILDAFLLNCFSSKEQVEKFKGKFISTRNAQFVFTDFLKSKRWNAVESFTKWSAVPDEEVNQLKREMICSDEGKIVFRDLVLYKGKVKVADEILKWCFSSEEEIKDYKKELIFSDIGVTGCKHLLSQEKTNSVDEFINWCLSSREEIEKLKKSFVEKMAYFVCKILKSNNSREENAKFKSCNCERAEKFFIWCLLSEEEINTFKRNVLLEMVGAEIHFDLIKSRQYEEAEALYAWFSLSAEKIRELKKKAVYDYVDEMMSIVQLCSETYEELDYGSEEEIEHFLKWCLTDKETALELKGVFEAILAREYKTEETDFLEIICLMIEQCLRALD